MFFLVITIVTCPYSLISVNSASSDTEKYKAIVAAGPGHDLLPFNPVFIKSQSRSKAQTALPLHNKNVTSRTILSTTTHWPDSLLFSTPAQYRASKGFVYEFSRGIASRKIYFPGIGSSRAAARPDYLNSLVLSAYDIMHPNLHCNIMWRTALHSS